MVMPLVIPYFLGTGTIDLSFKSSIEASIAGIPGGAVILLTTTVSTEW
jgi:hypothetical protein